MNKILLFWAMICVMSCGGGGKKTAPLDDATSGRVAIVADQTLMPMIDSERMVFESLYKDAKIDVGYFNQNEAFKQFLYNDTVRLIIASRRLDKTEEDFLASKQLVSRTVRVAVDGIALVVNTAFVDSVIAFETIEAMLNGKQAEHKNIRNIVFDNGNSGVIQFLKDSIFKDFDVANKHFFAQKTSDEVLDYVKKNKNAMGIMSACWIADAQAAQNNFIKDIKVLAVSPKNNKRYYYKPFEYYLSKGNYPLARNIYAISREPRTGLGTGFASFVAGQKGQLIIARMGLLPASIPVRTVEIVKE